MIGRDVKERVVLEVLPDRRTSTSVKKMHDHPRSDPRCNGREEEEEEGSRHIGVNFIPCRHIDDLPCIVTALGIIAGVVEQTAEVHKDGSRCVWRDKVSLHFLGRRKWRDCDGSVLQADMVLLSKRLNQCSTLKQGKDSPSNCFLFLKQNKCLLQKGQDN